MFKDYWNKKKHLIQLVGILTGVGALFLSISLPENIDARQALANIQLVWLIIITISCSILFISFHNFSVDLEKHYGSRWGIDLKETVSLVIFLSFFYLVINLWIYIVKLYSASLWDFLHNLNYAIGVIIAAIFFHFFRKFLAKFDRLYKRVLFTFFTYTLLSATMAFTSLFISNKGMSFSLINWLLLFGVFLVLLILLTVYDELRRSKKSGPKVQT